MTRFSVGVVGCGQIARTVHLPVLLNMPRVRLAWVADRSSERAGAVGALFGLKAVNAQCAQDLPECDVVLLAIPVGARAAYWQGLAAKKVAVLAEKPFAATSREHRRIAELFPPHRLACGYMRRFYGSTILLCHLLTHQWFGPLRRLRIAEGARTTRTGVDYSFFDEQGLSPGGVLADLGCHTLDLALYLTGAQGFEVESCDLAWDGRVDRKASARIRLKNSCALPDEGVELDHCVSWLDRQENRVELQFEQVSLWAGLTPGAQVFMGNPMRSFEALRLASSAPTGASTSNQAFYLEWDAFLTGLETERESPISACSAALTTVLLEQLYEKGGGLRA